MATAPASVPTDQAPASHATAIAAGFPITSAVTQVHSPHAPKVTSEPILWPRAAQIVTAGLLALAAILLAIYAFGSMRLGSRPTELERGQSLVYRVDLNRASRAELRNLPGIGEKLAERIEEFRRKDGGFESVDDLLKVPGIGPATLQKVRALVFVRGEGFDDDFLPKDAKAGVAKFPSKREKQLAEPIDINRATLAELQKLPGIGPKLSQRIVDERSKRPFLKVDELRRVSGIGPKTLEKVRPYVTVN